MMKGKRAPLTPQQAAELDALAAMPDSEIDTSDAPSVVDWSEAIRGAFFRPIKKPVAIRLDADVLDWFKRQGKGYQTRLLSAVDDPTSVRGCRPPFTCRSGARRRITSSRHTGRANRVSISRCARSPASPPP